MNYDGKNDIIGNVTSKDALILSLIAVFLFFTVRFLGFERIARGVLISATVILVTIRIFWPLNRRAWFWIAILLITIIHVVATMYVPLSGTALSGIRIAPVIALDFVFTFVVINVLARFLERGRNKRHPT